MSDESRNNIEPVVVIKKIVKKGHGGGHHGGAWKVAYADFITAMMALFMVLWLIAMLSADTKKAIAQYFRSYTIFKGTEAGGAKGMSMMQGNPIKLDPEPGDIKKTGVVKETIALELNKIVEEKLEAYKDQIMIFTTNDGVRLELMELEKSPMFEVGKATLLPRGREVIKVIADTLKDIPNNIAIEGHTDNRQYPGDDYTNWELAADRANAARRELIKDGLEPKKITKVTSFADNIPIDRQNPADDLNRRVSILIEAGKNEGAPPPNIR